MNLRVKIWLAGDDQKGFLGGGRYRLLQQIGQEGSLQKASRKLGISYRKAWGDIREVERRLGFELVHRQRGGSGGGTSALTCWAEKLLDAFGKIESEIENEAKKKFDRHLKKLLEKTEK